MKSDFLRAALLVSSVALIPAATAGMASVDANTYREMDQFLAVFERVRADYVDKVDDKSLIKGAINGMLASLDPHSSYLDARDFENMRVQTDGNYGGLGLTVSLEDGAVKVIAPTEDSPADKAGMKVGDYITHLDGVLIYGGTLDEAVDKMRGTPGTSIRLTVVRPGRDKPFDVTITRQIIEIKPVKWEVRKGIGIININGFSKSVGADVRSALVSIDKSLGHVPTGYIVDLRSNPGGLLDQAIEVSDAFLERGEIVSQRGRNRRDIERYYARPGDMAHGLPIIVLVDAGSASAAEIVAGALQDHHRALVMGERSFGKGSVQTLIQLDDSSALRLTTARYYTPSNRSVQEGGIEPDIAVPQLSDPDYKARPRFREADLSRHLINESKVDNSVLEADAKPDPRFSATADQLKAQGIKDFQLHYALETLGRLTRTQTATSSGSRKGSR
ncbi:MAG: S41 family peptidase [Sphingomonadales bacterium]|nr:S41 family peptidase [Sphingomonadales bacterium]MBK6719219.1 S41 family peptidase [Sphingomonadales bacterium]MBK9589059.1 S41 family peptidase [Sphingomonadales bacterium]MBP7136852.1 S41 family peptidase [Sphingomonadaceae bacterium]